MTSEDSSSSPHLVFSYGTLKRGFRNHYNMERDGIRYKRRCHTLEKFPMYCDHENRNRPCLANFPGHGYRVFGELFEVSAQALDYLDEFERVPSHYTRKLCEVKGEDGRIYQAHVYFNNTEERRRSELLVEKKFTMIPNYTMEWHRLYVPRSGNTKACVGEGKDQQKQNSSSSFSSWGMTENLHATLEALDLESLRMSRTTPIGGFSGGVVFDFDSSGRRLEFSVCYCGHCCSAFCSSLVDALTLPVLFHAHATGEGETGECVGEKEDGGEEESLSLRMKQHRKSKRALVSCCNGIGGSSKAPSACQPSTPVNGMVSVRSERTFPRSEISSAQLGLDQLSSVSTTTAALTPCRLKSTDTEANKGLVSLADGFCTAMVETERDTSGVTLFSSIASPPSLLFEESMGMKMQNGGEEEEEEEMETESMSGSRSPEKERERERCLISRSDSFHL
uniref:Gamma-glutamylcyclotransferase AIG2-like domain-containing protein n=1 Tax=Chromera velia CCMP2878 TaxID=1169474 RepID=A0A0G4IA15_9ALVE|eukprot:Cvel_12328.t1-p1 / transcript=Cvel_12328.t1 / gene=Cvel_12328 / organism=Chromera_velia_CCMP2878 / gene_product=Gamma-glutamylaminecyclotransferase, putative / transcript_product=Gamma-glutamylaminecyclotransferase, putative / location=Cvel_scaffold802:22174-24413(+) / protein_length=449 / sequence_SO=supercontig / SO=protein_coding / is_pseudo=false